MNKLPLLLTAALFFVSGCDSPGGGGGFILPQDTRTDSNHATGDTALPSDTQTIDTQPLGDTGPTLDSTAPIADTQVSPADTQVSPADTQVSPADTTVSQDTTAPPSCTPLDLSGPLTKSGESTYILGAARDTDLGFGSAAPDLFHLEFYSTHSGTFYLGGGDNANYKTCKQCIRAIEDISADGQSFARTLFQTGGEIYVGDDRPPGSDNFVVTFQDLTLAEVTISDDGTFTSTLVPGGVCYAISPTVLAVPDCLPSCADRDCGPDSCGGICGSCGGGHCSLDGQCHGNTSCQALTLSGPVLNHTQYDYNFNTPISEPPLGAVAADDSFSIELYAEDTGTFDLGSGANANYKTCEQCLRVFVDSGANSARQFYQSAGTMTISSVSSDTISVNFTGLELVEVTIGEDYTSTPVPGGACISIDSPSSLSTP